ncbi:hypothetical protein [Pseudogracilibacillus auburnensis]|uniref:hypothetical protein n=1 Tax=Pseudogracilibacillus auburnensis TaxID=1494959 RepID=UPI001A962D40|nr:hypothetical protein [Pseudogracilibacillus auburnensis]MBO1001797.1 hypothetical protein [Pseudogracilibacillus auburnensis]
MQKPVSYTKVGLDLFYVQLTWTFWALGIFLLINIFRLIFLDYVDSYYSGGYIAANIYMLVIGIIAINFLPYYVENGITRKNFFIGNVLASIGLSLVIPFLIYVISFFEKLILHNFTSIVLRDHTLEEVVEEVTTDIDGNIIGEIIQSIILTPFINPEANLILSLALFSLHIFVFYIIGWMIGAAFYRLGVIGGLIFIAIGLALIVLKDSMIRLVLDIPLFQNFTALANIPENLALPFVFIIVLVSIILIRLLTKRAPIKI